MRSGGFAIVVSAIILSGSFFAACGPHGEDFAGTVNIRGDIPENLYVGGGTVRVFGDAQADVVVAGGTLFIGNRVAADVLAAGGTIDLRAEVGGDARLAGGQITVSGPVAGDVAAFGGQVELLPGAVVGRRALLAGGTVSLSGRVQGDMQVMSGTLYIDGEIDGNLDVRGDHIELGPHTRIGGDFTYRSAREAVVHADARIQGRVVHEPVEPAADPAPAGRLAALFFWLCVLVAGIVFIGFFPRFSRDAGNAVYELPWQSLGIGFAAVVLGPILAAALLLTVIGAFVGLALFALYAVFLLVAMLTGIIFISDRLLRMTKRDGESKGKRILALTLVILLLALIVSIPILGPLALAVLFLFGGGGVVVQVYRQYRRASPLS